MLRGHVPDRVYHQMHAIPRGAAPPALRRLGHLNSRNRNGLVERLVHSSMPASGCYDYTPISTVPTRHITSTPRIAQRLGGARLSCATYEEMWSNEGLPIAQDLDIGSAFRVRSLCLPAIVCRPWQTTTHPRSRAGHVVSILLSRSPLAMPKRASSPCGRARVLMRAGAAGEGSSSPDFRQRRVFRVLVADDLARQALCA